ncbi:DMT family transporter [Kiritimatiellota bacterium B12222]|nr:DMT family transporter [Kiritimatiellota bacterium B12222]
MNKFRLFTLTSMAMIAFAGNSLLCRAALKDTDIDAASFTTVRLISAAAVLWLLLGKRRGGGTASGNWPSAIALFVYAAGFSFAYVSLPAATGALLLFAAVQATMMGYGFWTGERLHHLQLIGVLLAFGGLVGLLLPGLSAPPLLGSVVMCIAGVAWGIYSLRGRNAFDPSLVTTGNFLRAAPLSVAMSLWMSKGVSFDFAGYGYAVASGGLASGIGYAVWYMVLPKLKATHAATLQLSVPIFAALGAVLILGEAITPRLLFASFAILGGIFLVLCTQSKVDLSHD